jgi:predicted ATPase
VAPQLLGLVIEQAPTVPMLHVLTSRPTFSPPWPPRSNLTSLVLNRLESLQVAALITQRVGGKALHGEVVQHIVTKTDGVPLYVDELTKMLLASPLLREEAGPHYVLTGPLRSVAIPDTLQAALMARLDQLSAAEEIAQLTAVLGREFTYDLVQSIATRGRSRRRSPPWTSHWRPRSPRDNAWWRPSCIVSGRTCSCASRRHR